MRQAATARKVPEAARFTDLSDYARPLAVWIAGRITGSSVTAPQVTIIWAMIGVGGAVCYAAGGYGLALWGTAALQAKNVLDAVDGSLARLQNRPSRVGRFLDSIADAGVATSVFAALAVAIASERSPIYAGALGGAALVLGLLQASLYNYYYVRYRRRHRGDTTSRLDEKLTADDRRHYAGRPFALRTLRALLLLYSAIYGWQDRLVWRLDGWAAAPLVRIGRGVRAEEFRDERRLLTAVSALGPGMQIAILNLYTIAGRTSLALALELYCWTVVLGGTLYAASIALRLRRAAVQAARAAEAVPLS